MVTKTYTVPITISSISLSGTTATTRTFYVTPPSLPVGATEWKNITLNGSYYWSGSGNKDFQFTLGGITHTVYTTSNNFNNLLLGTNVTTAPSSYTITNARGTHKNSSGVIYFTNCEITYTCEAEEAVTLTYTSSNAEYPSGQETFSGPNNLNDLRNFIWYTLDAKVNLLTAKVSGEATGSASSLFGNCKKLTSVDLSDLDTSRITNMYAMFEWCEELTDLNISNLNTSNVTNMGYMFQYCGKLTNINLSSFDTSNVEKMSTMFYNCTSLEELDLSNFDTSKITQLSYMFYNCNALKNLNISNFNTDNTIYMSSMFYNCYSLEELDLSHFNTSKVTSFQNMFTECRNLKTLNILNFTAADNCKLASMFNNCSNLITIYCNNDLRSQTLSTEEVFNNCLKLVGAVSYNATKKTREMANPTTGYFTSMKLFIDFDGRNVNKIIFNGNEVSHLNFNGSVII